MIRKITTTLFLFLLVLVSTNNVKAADFRVPDDSGNLTISADEEVKNLYMGGDVLTVKADVEKSLYLGGNTIIIEGDIENDIFVGGGNVTIRGDVGGSVHAGGGTVIIEGNVADDVFIGGGNIMISETASIGEDLIIGGGNVTVKGLVEGNILLGAGSALINSEVRGKVTARVESLILGEKAKIGKGISYKAYEEAKIDEKAVILGEIEYEKIEKEGFYAADEYKIKSTFKNFNYIKKAIGLIISLVAGLFLLRFFKKWITVVIEKSLTNFGPNLGTGVLVLVLIPILIGVLSISIFGLWIGGFMVNIYTLMLSLATPLASIALGTLILKIFKGKKSNYVVDWKAVLVGVIIMALLGAFLSPLGILIKSIFVLIILGSLYKLTYQFIKKAR